MSIGLIKNRIIGLSITLMIVSISTLYAQVGTSDKPNMPTLKGRYLGQKTPGTVPVLFAPDIVSTANRNDRDLTISPDGNMIFFSRSPTGKNDDYDYDILYSEFKDGVWTTPKVAWFSTKYGEVEAFLTPDGNSIFFNSNRPATIEGKVNHWETWVMVKEGDKWSLPKLLGTPFNRVCYTTFTQKGKMYYTQEDIPALFYVDYTDGVFGKPKKLNAVINSGLQYNCFVSPDETYLIFTKLSNDKGIDDSDLYVSFRNDKNEWTKPLNMGPKINSEAMESCPSVSNDGKYLFFTSNKNGNNDVYWVSVKILDELKNRSSD